MELYRTLTTSLMIASLSHSDVLIPPHICVGFKWETMEWPKGLCAFANGAIATFLLFFSIIVIVNLFFAAIKCNKKLSERKDEIALFVEMPCLNSLNTINAFNVLYLCTC